MSWNEEAGWTSAALGELPWAQLFDPCCLNRSLAPLLGSSTSVAEINRLLKQYRTMQKMMKGVQGKWLKRAMGMGGGARA